MIANTFNDYQLLDSGNGKKLETIAGIKVERPSPQAIWAPTLNDKDWANTSSRCIRKKDGGGVWEHSKGDPSPLQLTWMSESDIKFFFKLKFTPFGHCGIFFEQSSVWNQIAKITKLQKEKIKGRAPRFLNLFGYTGAASIVAAKNGAEVYHIDSAKSVLDWGRENQKLNLINENSIKWFHSDVIRFLENTIKRQEKFDGILADPPSWGHGAKKEVWEFDKQISQLIELISKTLHTKNSYIILTTHMPGVQQHALKNVLESSLSEQRGFSKHQFSCDEMGIFHSNDKRILPAGIFSCATDL